MILDVIVVIVQVAIGVAAIYFFVKLRYGSRSIAWTFSSPADRAQILRAEAIVRRGRLVVSVPVFVTAFALVRVTHHVSGTRGIIILWAGYVLATMAWHSFGVRRWWRWAGRQGIEPSLIADLAEDVGLIWRQTTWFGRRQRSTWMGLGDDFEKQRLR